MAGYAARHGWPLSGFTENDPAVGAYRELMWEISPDLSFHYMQNDVSDDCVVFILGPDAETVRRTTETVRKDLPSLSPAELTATVHEDDPVERGRRVMRTSFAAPDEFDSEFFDVVQRAMSDPDDDVRNVAVLVATSSLWPQYRPELTRLARTDPSPRIRQYAQLGLDTYDAVGVDES